ncbi:hypothetical protein HDV05_005754 [Chytridiales sp. JEL 0842]|nr:hypothetical protein HDV05_005754 [Chytridiales sp. JEL 0842]
MQGSGLASGEMVAQAFWFRRLEMAALETMLQLFEQATKNNVVAYLDTGSGKTLVSVLLIEHHAKPLVRVSKEDILARLRGDSDCADAYSKVLITREPTSQSFSEDAEYATTADIVQASGPSNTATAEMHSSADQLNGGAVVGTDSSDISMSLTTPSHIETGTGETVSVPVFQYVLKPPSSTSLVTKDPTFQKTGDIVFNVTLPKQPKKIVFCVPTVPLVHQQAESIRRNTDLVVGEYSREDHASLLHWDPLGWYYEISQRHVLVSTPQIFLNILRHGFMNLSNDVSLIIFDECHHVWKNHPYSSIMREFYHTLPESQVRPKIFGMTASPIFQKTKTKESSVQRLNELRKNMDSEVVTVTDRSMLKGFIATAKESVFEYDAPPLVNDDTLEVSLQDILADETDLNRIYHYYCQEMEAIAKNKSLPAAIAQKQSKQLDNVRFVRGSLGLWAANQELLNEPTLQNINIDTDATPKVKTLVSIIKQRSSNFSDKKNFRAMVFVDQRITAFSLCDVLIGLGRSHFPDLTFSCMTGLGPSNDGHTSMNAHAQKTVLEKFRRGEINILIVTKVAEEGVDIPACRFVLLFDIFRSNTGYVQSRGRARDVSGSEYIIMILRDNVSVVETLIEAKVSEAMTRTAVSAIEESTSEQETSLEKRETDDAAVDVLVDTNEILKTKLTTVGPASATGILINYFNNRPVFELILMGMSSTISPEWTRYLSERDAQEEAMRQSVRKDRQQSVFENRNLGIDIPYGYAYKVVMQPSKGRREIYGPVRFTKKLAMESAALEAVRYLYAIGELRENLLPHRQSSKRKRAAFSFEKDISAFAPTLKTDRKGSMEEPRAEIDRQGLQKGLDESDTNSYSKHIPTCLMQDERWASLSAICSQTDLKGDISTVKDSSLDVYITIILFEESDSTVGLLTPNQLPIHKMLPLSFPGLFTNVKLLDMGSQHLPPVGSSTGQSLKPHKVTLTANQLARIAKCHTILWNYVSHEFKCTLKALFTPKTVQLGYLNMPMICSTDNFGTRWDIDWDTIDKVVADVSISLYDFARSVQSEEHKVFRSGPSKRVKLSTSSISENTHIKSSATYSSDDTLRRKMPALLDILSTYDSEALNKAVQNIIAITPHNGFTYYIHDLCMSMTAESPFTIEKMPEVKSYKDYFEKLGYKIDHPKDPLLRVHRTESIRRQILFEKSAQPEVSTAAYVYLSMDVAKVTPLSSKLYSFMLSVPLALSEVENYCTAEDLRRTFQPYLNDVRSFTLLKALTSTSASKSYDYERLEFYGDAFIKFISTLDLYLRFPNAGEGVLTLKRSARVSNNNLAKEARRLGIGEMIVISPFRYKGWIPPGGCQSLENGDMEGGQFGQERRLINEKKLADVIEALVGAACYDVGTGAGAKLLAFINVIDDSTASLLSDGSFEGLNQRRKISLADADRVNAIEQKLGYKFHDPSLALEAITHASASQGVSYERLEFLGDAVLDWLVTKFLFDRYENYGPEPLSELRVAMVNNESLCRMAVKLDLHKHMICHVEQLNWHLQAYAKYLEDPATKNLPLSEASFDGPKVLGDTFEAIIGAVLLDSGCSLEKSWDIFSPLLITFFEEFVEAVEAPKSVIRQLRETLQGIGFLPITVDFRVDFTTDEEYSKQLFHCEIYLMDILLGAAVANTRQLSKRLASVKGLKWISQNNDRLLELLPEAKVYAEQKWKERTEGVRDSNSPAKDVARSTSIADKSSKPEVYETLDEACNDDVDGEGGDENDSDSDVDEMDTVENVGGAVTKNIGGLRIEEDRPAWIDLVSSFFIQ